MLPGFVSAAHCISRARSHTRRSPVATSVAPLATTAANSPTLCPATNDGSGWGIPCRASQASRTAASAARLTETIAGCVTTVACKASGGPSNIEPVSEPPQTAFAIKNTSRAADESRCSECPIPTA